MDSARPASQAQLRPRPGCAMEGRSHLPQRAGPPDPVPAASTRLEGPTWRLGRGLEAVGDGPASSLPGGLIFSALGVFL